MVTNAPTQKSDFFEKHVPWSWQVRPARRGAIALVARGEESHFDTGAEVFLDL
jgi:hypothetical protein